MTIKKNVHNSHQIKVGRGGDSATGATAIPRTQFVIGESYDRAEVRITRDQVKVTLYDTQGKAAPLTGEKAYVPAKSPAEDIDQVLTRLAAGDDLRLAYRRRVDVVQH